MTGLPVYVAGKTHDYERVRLVQEIVRNFGHYITHDWTQTVEVFGPNHDRRKPTEYEMRDIAMRDRAGVMNAVWLVALSHPKAVGTIWELGMAAALNTPTILVSPDELPFSVFTYLPNIVHVPDIEALTATIPQLVGVGHAYNQEATS